MQVPELQRAYADWEISGAPEIHLMAHAAHRPQSFGVTVSEDALFSDLPLPKFKSISGKAKLLDDVAAGQNSALGYIVR